MGEHMTDSSDGSPQPSWKRFESFEGPTEDERTASLQQYRRRRESESVAAGGSLQQRTPRKAKCRDSKFNGIRIR